eukprot:547950-Ditylum_brightwellii.AAC.1
MTSSYPEDYTACNKKLAKLKKCSIKEDVIVLGSALGGQRIPQKWKTDTFDLGATIQQQQHDKRAEC